MDQCTTNLSRFSDSGYPARDIASTGTACLGRKPGGSTSMSNIPRFPAADLSRLRRRFQLEGWVSLIAALSSMVATAYSGHVLDRSCCLALVPPQVFLVEPLLLRVVSTLGRSF
jgi:hypothetical protein